MTNTFARLTAALLLAAVGLAAGTVSAQQAPKRAITKIAGDLYSFQNNAHVSVFLVTPAGVIATDPINADAATWLKAEIAKRFGQPIKYVIYSHDHADHSHGLDELRPLSYENKMEIPVYGDAKTLATLEHRFQYAFAPESDYFRPFVRSHVIDGPFTVGAIPVVPFIQQHGDKTSLGFRFGDIAYSTDVVGLPEASFEALDGVDVWIVDALQRRPHPTHSHLAQTLDWIKRVKPRRSILTHMTLDMDYATLVDELPPGVEPGYDGLVIEVPGP